MSKTYQSKQSDVKGQIMCRMTIQGKRIALRLPAPLFWATFGKLYATMKGVA